MHASFWAIIIPGAGPFSAVSVGCRRLSHLRVEIKKPWIAFKGQCACSMSACASQTSCRLLIRVSQTSYNRHSLRAHSSLPCAKFVSNQQTRVSHCSITLKEFSSSSGHLYLPHHLRCRNQSKDSPSRSGVLTALESCLNPLMHTVRFRVRPQRL